MAVRIFIVLVVMVAGFDAAFACSCGRIATANEARQYSSIVFEGTVVSKRIVLGDSRLGSETWMLPLEEYTFALGRSWKGAVVNLVRLRQGYSNCDNVFSGGETYLVFASTNEEDSSAYSSGKCSPTKPIASAAKEFRQLGPPVALVARSRKPLTGLSVAYFVRLYFSAGVTAYVNLFRHGGQNRAWRFLGGGAFLAAFAVFAFVAAVVALVRSRVQSALALFLVAVVLGIAALPVSGATVLGNGFYMHYKQWNVVPTFN